MQHQRGPRDRRGPEMDARQEGISSSFFKLQKRAREHGCWWINLDRDADPVPGLPVNAW